MKVKEINLELKDNKGVIAMILEDGTEVKMPTNSLEVKKAKNAKK